MGLWCIYLINQNKSLFTIITLHKNTIIIIIDQTFILQRQYNVFRCKAIKKCKVKSFLFPKKSDDCKSISQLIFNNSKC